MRSANPGQMTGSKSLMFHIWDGQLVVRELNLATACFFSGSWEHWPVHMDASRGSGDVSRSTSF